MQALHSSLEDRTVLRRKIHEQLPIVTFGNIEIDISPGGNRRGNIVPLIRLIHPLHSIDMGASLDSTPLRSFTAASGPRDSTHQRLPGPLREPTTSMDGKRYSGLPSTYSPVNTPT